MPASTGERTISKLRVHHRLKQGVRAIYALTHPPTEQAIEHAALYLAPEQMKLFRKMRPVEIQHSLNVLDSLEKHGETDRALLVAALLHDVGKTRFDFKLWERVLVVLARKADPTRAERWGEGAPVGWKKMFVVSAQHPIWSAELAADAGVDPLAVQLIARHQDKTLPADPKLKTKADRLLHLLQEADDDN